MSLTPEQQDALNAAVEGHWLNENIYAHIFLAGLRMGRAEGREQAARVCDKERDEVQARLDAGKGTWPQQDYVRDDAWNRWHGERSASESLAVRIRALPEEPT